jgi:hypothetical protein
MLQLEKRHGINAAGDTRQRQGDEKFAALVRIHDQANSGPGGRAPGVLTGAHDGFR